MQFARTEEVTHIDARHISPTRREAHCIKCDSRGIFFGEKGTRYLKRQGDNDDANEPTKMSRK